MHLNALESIYSEKKINLSKSKGKLFSEKNFTSVVSFKKCAKFNFSTFSVYVEEKLRMVIWHIFEETTILKKSEIMLPLKRLTFSDKNVFILVKSLFEI